MITKRCHCPTKPNCRCPYWYFFELHGTRYRKSTRTANRQTAGRIEERRRVAILENRDEENTSISLKDHIKAYVAHTAKTNATAYKDQAVLDRLLDVCGDRQLHEISPFHIEKWKRDRTESVERSTVNRELNIVRGCFARAVDWKQLAASPVDAVKIYKVDDHRVRILDNIELRKVLDADPFVALVCRVTLECLPRISEVLALRREHIGPTWMEVRRKGGRVERLAITNELREKLLVRCHKKGAIFGEGEKGLPPQRQTASHRIVRELLRLGIKGASHHTMRHTGVTLMLEAGVNPRVIQRLAGWSSLRMLERYGHARDTEFRRAVTGNAAYLDALPATVPTNAITQGKTESA